ncbi:dihydrofolate reductase family protein [Dactylosporangium vinaceum]|uniref:Dihydrofolate reductase family protein n=1 Tax=Dactylosporangium vinaceum TaxID=53362 RepID=A0ABV5MMN4_9ACTN|nr:dihydrofolate reductase family protein [Dactylosporangium vinaceum]UAB93221.1 dihydrofolate reductase family protein [Dactylosporangium vinaceum]
MGKLIYVTNLSLDGYIEDPEGVFAWLPMDDELFAFYTDLLRPVGTMLYGRRMYEGMATWETDPTLAARSEPMAGFANVWQAASKVVYSTTLPAVTTAGTRLERRFDPAAVRELKTATGGELTIGGADLAAQAFRAGLVDECRLFLWPVALGGGKPGLPTGTRTDLELLDERRFANGVLHLHYRTADR